MEAGDHGRTDQAMPSIAYDKNAILQEAKVFSKVPISNSKCIAALTKVLCLLNNVEDALTEAETTDIFFGATRLFESKDLRLRRLVYLLIKSIRVNETEIFIVTSSLTKDINSPNVIYRANAIRAMCLIVKSNVASQVERYIKSALVDKDPYVCSSALLCCIRLFTQMPQLVRGWVGEAATCLTSSDPMVQFHGAVMLYLARLNDKNLLAKLVATLRQQTVARHTECFLIRLAVANFGLMREECVELIRAGHKHDKFAVKVETLKAVVSLALAHHRREGNMQDFPFDLKAIVAVLDSFLSSKDVTLHFVAMRQASLMAATFPLVISSLNQKFETFLKSANGDVASFAMVTLVQTGGSDTIERLLKQAESVSGGNLSAIAEALKTLCVSFPEKHAPVLKFFASRFRDAKDKEVKREMINMTAHVVERVPQSHEAGMKHLCDFIEDCEHADLNAQVLKLLGDHVHKTKTPEAYVRFIYNRLLLENATVRHNGVEALNKIMGHCPALKDSVSMLMLPCLEDPEDELRERANLTCALVGLEERVRQSNSRVQFTVAEDADGDAVLGRVTDPETASQLCDVVGSVSESGSVDQLCRVLQECIVNKGGYDAVSDAMIGVEDEETREATPSEWQEREAQVADLIDTGAFVEESDACEDVFPAEVRAHLPQDLPMTSSRDVALTDEEEDYSVEVRFHATERCVVFEFVIGNTLAEHILEDVAVAVDYSQCLNAARWKLAASLPIDRLAVSEKKSAYVVLANASPVGGDAPHFGLLLGNVKVDLDFQVKSGGEDARRYKENYSANDLHLGVGMYCVEWALGDAEFARRWDGAELEEACATFSLQLKDLKDAVQGLRRFFGNCSVAQGSAPSDRIATLRVAGKLLAERDFFARATIGQSGPQAAGQPVPQKGCMLKLQVRAGHRGIAEAIFALLE
ncbi:coat protein, gamma subunit [Babesia caballi]|uniref:Coatomer subunit gamma n=1 Tax=Babesia caballi TaxID=5871 RepID=A0AAV4LWZ5_BABCB|nr:coat protein, gamma subunit [Babesia caballi]